MNSQKVIMENKGNEVGPMEEQAICVMCGLCCDGTLFLNASLKPGEKGNLPEKIEQHYRMEKDREYFVLPCPYFKEKCTIYNQRRADVCSAYRCQLLKNIENKKISRVDALNMIFNARKIRDDLLEEYRKITGNVSTLHFKLLLTELGKIQKVSGVNNPMFPEFEMLLAKCNIFEAILLRHFKSEDEFGKLLMG